MATAVKESARVRQETILVVEDELRSQRLLRLNLEPLGYHIITLNRAEGVLAVLESEQPDLVVLDIRLPDSDGFAVCQGIRCTSAVPIIVLSAYGQPIDKARALELGADDYITKPYDPTELAARIEAVLRRSRRQPFHAEALFQCGPLTIDFAQHLVTLSHAEVPLSRTEYRLLEYLALNAGRTLVADAIIANVWGFEYMGDYASLHLYISRLRRKLGEDAHATRFIITKPGIGYMMPNNAGPQP